ncbi:MAG: hypothetical protein P8Z34_14250 [Anaerolineales bacterium]
MKLLKMSAGVDASKSPSQTLPRLSQRLFPGLPFALQRDRLAVILVPLGRLPQGLVNAAHVVQQDEW